MRSKLSFIVKKAAYNRFTIRRKHGVHSWLHAKLGGFLQVAMLKFKLTIC